MIRHWWHNLLGGNPMIFVQRDFKHSVKRLHICHCGKAWVSRKVKRNVR